MTSRNASEAPVPPTGGVGVSLCTHCGKNPRAARGSWCQECRREAQREYNTKTRARPEVKHADCQVCGKGMEWLSGRGPNRVYCSTKCKRTADGTLQTVRRRRKVAPERRAVIAERAALANQGYRRCNTSDEVKRRQD